MAFKRLALVIVARILHILSAITPVRRQVYVTSWPAKEGNGIETVRALIRRYSGKVIWADAPPDAILQTVGISPAQFTAYPKNSFAGVWSFVTAEATFFTHGVYGCPYPTARKPMVNLWHGDGPKSEQGVKIPSTYVVSGSRVFGSYRAEQFGVDPVAGLILSGLPRVSQLLVPLTDDQLMGVGLDPGSPVVVWMPTYRQAQGAGRNGSWSDIDNVAEDGHLSGQIAPGLKALADLGVQVVVKPHPLDVMSRQVPGLILVTDDDLERVGAPLYSLLGSAAALITDYSSVWTDYLTLDRPIGFFMPDIDAYVAKRGFYPADAMSHLPGPTLTSVEDFQEFADEVLGRSAAIGPRRREDARRHFGLVQETSPADVMLDELERRGALRLGE